MKYEPTTKQITWISPLLINLCVKCVFNAQYCYVKHFNYEWMNFAWFLVLSHEMLILWCTHYYGLTIFQIPTHLYKPCMIMRLFDRIRLILSMI